MKKSTTTTTKIGNKTTKFEPDGAKEQKVTDALKGIPMHWPLDNTNVRWTEEGGLDLSRPIRVAVKRKVWEFEQTNVQYIVFFRKDKDWWKVAGRSAMFLQHRFVARLGLEYEPSYTADRDMEKEWIFPSGMLSFTSATRCRAHARQ